jgi:hypothetical protein
LRCLKMLPVSLESISHLLSSAMALVELSLKIDIIFGPSPAASLVAHLQAMPCLHWLALCLPPVISHPHILKSLENGEKIVPLSKLIFFSPLAHFRSQSTCVIASRTTYKASHVWPCHPRTAPAPHPFLHPSKPGCQ